MPKKITIRYKKPAWREWIYLRLNENEVEKMVAELESQGYQVEK